MDEYIKETLTQLNTNMYRELTIVLGNESCDLDSAVSSIVYAAFLSWQHEQISCKVCTRGNRPPDMKPDIFVPILNVDRSDYELKTEVAFLLRNNGIYESNLVFRDDHDLLELMSRSTCKVVLVDHHNLAKRDLFLAQAVTEIIDHRPLDKSVWCYQDDTRATIETVGSCCTLIAQRIKDLGKLIAKDVDFFYAHPKCTKLLYSTIILDTVNFSKQVDKATPHDEEIVQFLESVIKPRDYSAERQNILDTLVAARSNVYNLTAGQLLKKDVKIVGSMLVPSFPMLVKDFLKKPGAVKSVRDALKKQGCAIALLLGIDLSSGVQRDVAVYSINNPETTTIFCKHLEEWTSPPLGLSPEILSDAAEFNYYGQSNLSASRKQFIPAVKAFFDVK